MDKKTKIDHLRGMLAYWDGQMDQYDDAGDYRAYARAEMEHRAAEAELNGLLTEEGDPPER